MTARRKVGTGLAMIVLIACWQGIGSGVNAQNAAAAAPTTGVVPAAADEVSALTAAQFVAHAQMYQAVSAQAHAIHEMFVNTLGTSARSYAATEAATDADLARRGRRRGVHPPCEGAASTTQLRPARRRRGQSIRACRSAPAARPPAP